ncbi:MAG TPA: YozE family protein [Polyangiaceae bacterium]|jgi:uncharacterized protein YozE (UPF0346 family)
MSKFATFYEWLSKQKNQHSPLGQFAGNALRDPNFPKNVAGVDALLGYLREQQADGLRIATARLAWQTYARGQK